MGALEVIRVVLETNVLVSGLLFGGTPGKLVDLWKTGRIQLVMAREMVSELLKVLAYPKFQLSEEEIHYLLYVQVLPYAEMIEARPGPVLIAKDPSDDIFLHCALTGGAKCIISGDRHLLGQKTFKRIKIVAPAEFLSSLLA